MDTEVLENYFLMEQTKVEVKGNTRSSKKWPGLECFPIHILSLPSLISNMGVFSSESALCIRWPKYGRFSFSIRPSNEYSVLISFRIYWFDLLIVSRVFSNTMIQSINFLMLNLCYGPTLASIHDYWKKHSFD